MPSTLGATDSAPIQSWNVQAVQHAAFSNGGVRPASDARTFKVARTDLSQARASKTEDSPYAGTAFALMPSDSGPILASPEAMHRLLRADWALFLELTAYALHGLAQGRVAFGVEEVKEVESQARVAVLFVPVGCGKGGEAAVRRVVAAGGRGYVVGAPHELHDDVADWGAAAILNEPMGWCPEPRLRISEGFHGRAQLGQPVGDGRWVPPTGEPPPPIKTQFPPAPQTLLGVVGQKLPSQDREPCQVPVTAVPSQSTAQTHSTAPTHATSESSLDPLRIAQMAIARHHEKVGNAYCSTSHVTSGTRETQAPQESRHPEVKSPAVAERSQVGGPSASESATLPPTSEVADVPAAKHPWYEQALAARTAERLKELKRLLVELGTADSLKDKKSIPTMAASVRSEYLPSLGAADTFTAFHTEFSSSSGVAHRKAILYVAHELLTKKSGTALATEDRRRWCLQNFLLQIGSIVQSFPDTERSVYFRLPDAWDKAKALTPHEIEEVRVAWGALAS